MQFITTKLIFRVVFPRIKSASLFPVSKNTREQFCVKDVKNKCNFKTFANNHPGYNNNFENVNHFVQTHLSSEVIMVLYDGML